MARRRGPQRRPLKWRLIEAWERAKRLLRLGRGGPDAPPDDPYEPALVPLGPPRRPRPSSAVELELPEEPDDVDAYGREADTA
jgi:hypothetical protein